MRRNSRNRSKTPPKARNDRAWNTDSQPIENSETPAGPSDCPRYWPGIYSEFSEGCKCDFLFGQSTNQTRPNLLILCLERISHRRICAGPLQIGAEGPAWVVTGAPGCEDEENREWRRGINLWARNERLTCFFIGFRVFQTIFQICDVHTLLTKV